MNLAVRFTGTVEPFATLDVKHFVRWLDKRIPPHDWPKMSDAAYMGWGEMFQPIADTLVRHYYHSCSVSGIGMFTLDPGVIHPAHADVQTPDWMVRVHVPIVTNPGAVIVMGDGEHHLQVGKAYRMNTLATHAVENRGKTPRLHFIFDVKG